MKITNVQGIALRCKCEPISDALSTSTSRQALLVRIDTDTEICGIGEAFTFGAPLPVMKYLVEHELGPMIIGSDPEKTGELWNRMYMRSLAHGRRGILMGALSGIDIALWDLLGKAAHLPVVKLLGQHYDKVPTYASAGFYAPGKGLDGLKREFEHYRRMGYRDAKLKIGRYLTRITQPLNAIGDRDNTIDPEEDYRRIETVRSVMGDGRLLADTNATWDARTVLARGHELVRLGVCWLEEPLPFEDCEGYRRIASAIPELSIIGCETQQGPDAFAEMIRQGMLDIVQADVGWAGGFSACVQIGHFAALSGRKVSLHCFGSAVLFAASLHLAASMQNMEMLESEENPNPLKSEMLTEPLQADKDMNFYVPDGPGLGITVDFAKMEKYIVR